MTTSSITHSDFKAKNKEGYEHFTMSLSMAIQDLEKELDNDEMDLQEIRTIGAGVVDLAKTYMECLGDESLKENKKL